MRKYRSSEKDFSRERTLTFPVVVKSILHLFKESVEYNMQKVLPLLGESPVTGSAFSQARYKVRYEFFCDLCSLVRDFYEDMPKKRWKGIYRLIAGDGSTLSLPNTEEVEDYFHLTPLETNEWLTVWLESEHDNITPDEDAQLAEL
ncbi:MAG: hypothetical protein GY786_25280, partial [Proteobacteria bacterium]|nr:hypothetical protein [Pseudomonadota bacterium]